MIIRTLVFLVILTPRLGFGQPTIFLPRDDSGKGAALSSFITELKQIIKNKDGQKLITIIHPKIKTDFDEGVGIDHFKKAWRPEDKNSELWTLMNKLVELGGVFTNNRADPFYDFVFPYVNQIDLGNADDFFTTLVVTGRNVNVREKPDIKSKTLGQLTYEVVRYNYQKSYPKTEQSPIHHLTFYGPKEWYYVETTDKRLVGFINWDFVWSPVGYRMFLTKETGNWMISCLISGD